MSGHDFDKGIYVSGDVKSDFRQQKNAAMKRMGLEYIGNDVFMLLLLDVYQYHLSAESDSETASAPWPNPGGTGVSI